MTPPRQWQILDHFQSYLQESGVEFHDIIEPRQLPNRGTGIVATEDIKVSRPALTKMMDSSSVSPFFFFPTDPGWCLLYHDVL